MQANDLLKLQASLTDAIQTWIDSSADDNTWLALDTYIGDRTAELMSSNAFMILLAQKNLTEYLKKEQMLND